jgi:hypothetical protein
MLYNRSDAELSELISLFSNEFAQNGQIVSTAVREAIQNGQKNANPSKVIEKMKNFYSERGMTLLIQDFSKFVDFNGDGIIDDNDEALNEQPTAIVEEDIWNTENGILHMLGGTYRKCWQFVNSQLNLEFIRTESSHSIDSNNSTLSKALYDAYGTINYTNMIIANVQNMIENHPESQHKILEINAEARLIRAFVYYNLAMLWGNVVLSKEPILTINEAQNLVQSDQADVYNLVYQEVCEALPKMPAQPNTTRDIRFTYKSALMLKAEIELTLGKNNEANTTLSLMDESPNFVLQDENNVIVSIYTPVHQSLFQKEASGNLTDAATYWISMPNIYGYWSALKRLGKAQDVTGCYDYELLMPFPSAEIADNPYLTQNPGY